MLWFSSLCDIDNDNVGNEFDSENEPGEPSGHGDGDDDDDDIDMFSADTVDSELLAITDAHSDNSRSDSQIDSSFDRDVSTFLCCIARIIYAKHVNTEWTSENAKTHKLVLFLFHIHSAVVRHRNGRDRLCLRPL